VKYISESETVVPLEPGVTLPTKGNPILTFDAVVISEGQYNYLLKCQDYVESRGIRP
jgi:hypothetical protein